MSGTNKLSQLNFFAVIVFAIYYILPSGGSIFNVNTVLIGAMGYIFLYCLQRNMKMSTEIIKYLILIFFISVLYFLLTNSSSIAGDVSNRGVKRIVSKVYQMGTTFLPLLFLVDFINNGSMWQKKTVLRVSYALYGYVVIVTLRELMINPNITRSWASFAESSQDNIASYYFVYAVPFLIGLCTMLLFRTKKMQKKIAALLCILFQFYFLLLAQYTLSVLIAVVGVAYIIYINSQADNNRIIIVLVLIVLSIMSPWILKYAAEHVPSAQMSTRLYEIYYFLVGGDTTGYNLNGRMTLYMESVKAFIQSPLWGNRDLGFDGHATFLTVLSDIGLLGGIPYYYLYFHAYSKVKEFLNTPYSFKPFFVIMIMMGFTNPIHLALPLMFAVWFIVPLTIDVWDAQGYYGGRYE